MNNKKKRTLKGFTLIELIIVMAIVSVLMLAVMKVSQPAVKIMNNTSNAEKTYGYTDNIRTYLQTQLEYSDALWVIPENELGNVSFQSMRHPPEYDAHGVEVPGTATMITVGDGSSIEDAVKDFADENYFGTVSHNGTSSGDIMGQIQPLKGKINVLRLLNHDHDSFKAGQITLTTYDFESYNNTSDYFASTGIKITGSTPETLAINDAYFEAYDAKDYTFSYALGAYDLEGDSSITGSSSTETFKTVSEDKDDKDIVLNNYNDLAVSIFLNTGDAVDLPGTSSDFRAFRNPSQISVANLPLMNISYHGGVSIGRLYVNKEYYDTPSASYIPQLIKWHSEGSAAHPVSEKSLVQAFRSVMNTGHKIDFTEDIYFIYSYATDLE